MRASLGHGLKYNGMENEIWKDISGHEGVYQVSDLGRVKKLPVRTCEQSQVRKDRKKIIPGKFLPQRLRSGYWSVVLRVRNKSIDSVVHRLVAIAFVANPENKPQVNHIDGNKKNNNVKNLEWVTKSENAIHAVKLNLVPTGSNHKWAKLKEADAQQILNLKSTGVKGAKVARRFGLTKGAVYAIWNRTNWKKIIQ